MAHADWCHIDMGCCGCTCRDAYTDYVHTQRGEVECPTCNGEGWIDAQYLRERGEGG